MLETSARLLRLLSLLQARRDWPGKELAGRLGVDVRTVRRDIERLRVLGYPVNGTTGAAGGYRLGAGTALPPLLLDDDEAVAVVIGLRTAAGGTVAGIEETSVRALAKLEQVLPSRLRHHVNALHTVVPMSSGTAPVDPSVLTLLATACRDHDRLRFDYHGHDGTGSIRTVEPHRLVHTGRRWYLLAWDTGREAWRTFRVDRIEPRTPTGPRFVPREPPAADVAAYISRMVSTEVYRYQARCTVHAPVEVVTERIPPTVGVVESIDEHTCRLETGANSLEVLAVHLALLGVDFEVHDPPELVATVRALAGTFGRASR